MSHTHTPWRILRLSAIHLISIVGKLQCCSSKSYMHKVLQNWCYYISHILLYWKMTPKLFFPSLQSSLICFDRVFSIPILLLLLVIQSIFKKRIGTKETACRAKNRPESIQISKNIARKTSWSSMHSTAELIMNKKPVNSPCIQQLKTADLKWTKIPS